MAAMVLALAGCSAAPPWEKPGASQAAVHEAMQNCRVQASLAPQPHLGAPVARSSGAPGLERIEDRQAREAQQFQNCMQDQGYRVKR